MMDEEDEDIEEEDLDIAGEIYTDSPPWDLYNDPDIDDIEDTNEDTALLRTAAKTEIIVTPMSPVRSLYFIFIHIFSSLKYTFK